MRKIIVPEKPVDAIQLHAELIAKDVPLRSTPFPGNDVNRAGDALIVVINTDTEDVQYDAVVAEVIAAHNPLKVITSPAPEDRYDRLVAALEKRFPGILDEINAG